LLSKRHDIGCEFIRIEYAPGSSIGKEQIQHEGVECGFIIQGELLLELGEESYILKTGDSITFPSTTPHWLSNPGSSTTIAVWVNSIPWLFINR
jgi:quercetin dioxygenase-like cupin family protein